MKREQEEKVNGGIMDHFTRRELNSDLRDLKMKMEEINNRLNEEDEAQETLGIKTIEMGSDSSWKKSYTVSRMVTVKWHCTCPDNRYRSPGECKHIQRAQTIPLDRFE